MGKQAQYKSLINEIEKWKNTSFKQANEAELVRILDNDLLEDEDQIADVMAMLAGRRYERKREWDNQVDQLLTGASDKAPSSPYVADIWVDLALSSMNEPWFLEELPKIRETDHSQGRKSKIDRLLTLVQQAKAWYQELKGKEERIEHVLRYATDEDKKEKIKEALSLIEQVGNCLEEILRSAKAYKRTINGIYASREKKQQLDDALDELKDYLHQWETWRKTTDEEETTALATLYAMTGIDEVKRKVETHYHYLEYEKERQRQGYHFENERSLNMILTGNPGTGKTSIARLLAKIYYDLGVLPREEVVEVDRSHLVGAYVGQTEEKTMKVIQQALGGILFIDEAYSLKREGSGGADYGQTAIDTLVSALTSGDYAGKFAVILAGYPEEMRTFLWSNPGLRSRFPETNHIYLPDFSMEELLEIAEHVALDNDFSLTEEALTELRKRLEKEKVDESFGNARTVKNIILDAIFHKGAQTAKEKVYSKESFTVLDADAFKRHDRTDDNDEQVGETQLNKLVGLTNVKREVHQLSSFVQMQKKREKLELPTVPIQLHAVFTGSPGTGKTTVASIYSQILYDLGLLKRGHMIVTGRSDLVAGYVGQTAIKTKKKIREALGGVLFIDEAYSLVSKGPQDFGREAVDTLVEEMSKHGENLVVVLAGYSAEIAKLMKTNPGLASRFKKYIDFPDYSPDELLQILKYYIDQFGYTLDDTAEEALRKELHKRPQKGNGRAMKDQVEEAVQRQAFRLIQEANSHDVSRLTIDDFPLMDEED
ncbi:AAA family ATPase [Salipaludibacillus agaradhaerens]|uniref:AAA family ATPase n=1 Tax=Salipaludibacillus agaradhaerens TaxID=76935 RepID=UPI00099849B5|nr:AAA family ATPase [Salipaludibacillus agaradhaerens]